MQLKISLEQLRASQKAGNVMRQGPSDWNCLDIPADLKEAWQKYLMARRDLLNVMEVYDLDTRNM